MKSSYLSSIHHDGSARYVHPHGSSELHIGDEVTLRLRAAVEAPIERLLLRTCPDGAQLFVQDGAVPDGALFREIFSGQTLTVQDGYLNLRAIPAGVQVWRSVRT
jgi:hypothetical protein